MIRALKELKRQMDARAASDEVERDEEGRAIITSPAFIFDLSITFSRDTTPTVNPARS